MLRYPRDPLVEYLRVVVVATAVVVVRSPMIPNTSTDFAATGLGFLVRPPTFR